MYNIKYNLPTFISELKRGAPLSVSLNGDFYLENLLQQGLRLLFNLDQRRLIQAAQALLRQMEDLESVSVRFSQDSVQEVDFQLFAEACQLLIGKLCQYHTVKAIRARARLERSRAALLYRLEGSNGGLDPEEVDEGIYHQLIHAAQVWKLTQQIFPDKDLSAEERMQLREACRYSLFTRLVLRDAVLAENFFLWALRDRIAVRTFIEFPFNQWKMNWCGLNGRLSRHGGKGLAVQKVPGEHGLEKVLTLPFEGRPINILDETKSVLFRGSYGLTIREIFEIFKHKRVEAGNLEYMAEGIINWSSHLWGYWDADCQNTVKISLAGDDWWKALPSHERLSLQEARRRFGGHLTGKEWNLALISARVTQDLDFENAHAYTSISVPQPDGSYFVYTFGKCTFTFPETVLKALRNIGETAEATIAYPDENVFYTERRKTHYSYAITEQEGRRYFASVKKDMLLSREENFIYQIESENCAKWSHEKLIDSIGQHRVPVIYNMPFLDSEPNGVMERVFLLLKTLPKSWQIPVTIFIHFLLGAYKGRLIIENGRAVWKSLTYHDFWDDTVIYHPSMLYKKQEEGNLGRFVPAGVTLVGRALLRIFARGIYALKKSVSRLLSTIYDFSKREFFTVSLDFPLGFLCVGNSQVIARQ